jgi:hypothetical protein
MAWGYVFSPAKAHEEFEGKFFVATELQLQIEGGQILCLQSNPQDGYHSSFSIRNPQSPISN